MSNEYRTGGNGRAWPWTYKRRGRFSTKSPARKKKSMSQFVTKRQLPSMVMKTVNKKAEIKHFFHEFKSAVADQDGDVYHLSNISEAVGTDDRIAKNIMVTGIEVGGFFNNDEANESALARLIIFRANEALSTTPSPNQILTTLGDIRAPVSLYNVDNTMLGPPGSNRAMPAFTIYYDNWVSIGDEGGSVTKQIVKANLKFDKPLPCQYIGAAGTDEGPGQWYMLYCSSIAAGTTTCQWNADVRIYYTDV